MLSLRQASRVQNSPSPQRWAEKPQELRASGRKLWTALLGARLHLFSLCPWFSEALDCGHLVRSHHRFSDQSLSTRSPLHWLQALLVERAIPKSDRTGTSVAAARYASVFASVAIVGKRNYGARLRICHLGSVRRGWRTAAHSSPTMRACSAGISSSQNGLVLGGLPQSGRSARLSWFPGRGGLAPVGLDPNVRGTDPRLHVPCMCHGVSVTGWERTPESAVVFEKATESCVGIGTAGSTCKSPPEPA